jgi:hypothetical protein
MTIPHVRFAPLLSSILAPGLPSGKKCYNHRACAEINAERLIWEIWLLVKLCIISSHHPILQAGYTPRESAYPLDLTPVLHLHEARFVVLQLAVQTLHLSDRITCLITLLLYLE